MNCTYCGTYRNDGIIQHDDFFCDNTCFRNHFKKTNELNDIYKQYDYIPLYLLDGARRENALHALNHPYLIFLVSEEREVLLIAHNDLEEVRTYIEDHILSDEPTSWILDSIYDTMWKRELSWETEVSVKFEHEKWER